MRTWFSKKVNRSEDSKLDQISLVLLCPALYSQAGRKAGLCDVQPIPQQVIRDGENTETLETKKRTLGLLLQV